MRDCYLCENLYTMFKRLKSKIQAKKSFKKMKEFLLETKDYETKEVVILEDKEKNINFPLASKVIKIHCESVGRETKERYIVINSDDSNSEAYQIYFMLSVAFAIYRLQSD